MGFEIHIGVGVLKMMIYTEGKNFEYQSINRSIHQSTNQSINYFLELLTERRNINNYAAGLCLCVQRLLVAVCSRVLSYNFDFSVCVGC